MERLPDRPDMLWEKESAGTGSGSKVPAKKQTRKEKLGTYGFLILIIVMLVVIMQKSEVPLDEITVTDCSPNDTQTSFFVAGTLDASAKFAGAQVHFDESTGVAEITLYQYATPTFFGSRDFVAMIDTSKAEVKEIWLKNETGRLQVM